MSSILLYGKAHESPQLVTWNCGIMLVAEKVARAGATFQHHCHKHQQDAVPLLEGVPCNVHKPWLTWRVGFHHLMLKAPKQVQP